MFNMSKDIHFCWVGIPWQRSVIGDEISRQPLDQSDGAPHVWGALLVFDLCELRLLLGKVSLTLFGVICFNDIKSKSVLICVSMICFFRHQTTANTFGFIKTNSLGTFSFWIQELDDYKYKFWHYHTEGLWFETKQLLNQYLDWNRSLISFFCLVINIYQPHKMAYVPRRQPVPGGC